VPNTPLQAAAKSEPRLSGTFGLTRPLNQEDEMVSIGISIDVPDLTEGVRFYSEAFGFSKSAVPVPGVVVMKVGATTVCLLEKKAGSKPSPKTRDLRRYERHWTPVHLDVHVQTWLRRGSALSEPVLS
jgi:hypothetical protein